MNNIVIWTRRLTLCLYHTKLFTLIFNIAVFYLRRNHTHAWDRPTRILFLAHPYMHTRTQTRATEQAHTCTHVCTFAHARAIHVRAYNSTRNHTHASDTAVGTHNHYTITAGKLVPIWLIENYSPRFKENGSGAVNSSNTIENTLKLP